MLGELADVELEGGDPSDGVEPLRGARLQLPNHPDGAAGHQDQRRPPRMPWITRGIAQDPLADPERIDQGLQRPLRVEEVELARLRVKPLPCRSVHDRRHQLALLDGAVEPEGVSHLEQGGPPGASGCVAAQGLQQVRHQAGPEERLVGGWRVGHANPRRRLDAHEVEVGRRGEREGQGLSEARPDQGIADAPPELVCGRESAGPLDPGEGRPEVVVPLHPDHLFDQVDLLLEVRPKAGHLDLDHVVPLLRGDLQPSERLGHVGG